MVSEAPKWFNITKIKGYFKIKGYMSHQTIAQVESTDIFIFYFEVKPKGKTPEMSVTLPHHTGKLCAQTMGVLCELDTGLKDGT